MRKTLKTQMQEGAAVYGTFIKACASPLIEILGYSGLDYVLLDMEHSPVGMDKLEELLRAANLAQISAIVRVAGKEETDLIHPLDKGADGLLVPMVSDARQAELVVDGSKFSPMGNRGMDVYARSSKFGFIKKDEYLRDANETTLLAIQIEGQEGVANLHEILSVNGIDVVYVGPYDLSQSLGLPGQVDNPRVVEEIIRIVGEIRKAGRFAGIYVDDAKTAARYKGIGVQFITVAVDVELFARACRQLVADLGK